MIKAGVLREPALDSGRLNRKSKQHGKSKAFTYLLWLVGGVCGLHHFYLGRDLQGVLWWCTFGGYFGFGWLRDVFYIGEYVADANNDEKYMQKVNNMIREHYKVNKTRPPSRLRECILYNTGSVFWDGAYSMVTVSSKRRVHYLVRSQAH